MNPSCGNEKEDTTALNAPTLGAPTLGAATFGAATSGVSMGTAAIKHLNIPNMELRFHQHLMNEEVCCREVCSFVVVLMIQPLKTLLADQGIFSIGMLPDLESAFRGHHGSFPIAYIPVS